MSSIEETFEKVPDFFVDKKEINEEKKIDLKPEEKASLNSKLEEILLHKPAMKIEQAFSTIEFETYKDDLKILFKELSDLNIKVLKWDTESFLDIHAFIYQNDLTELLTKISYLPNSDNLPKLLELIAFEVENGNYDLGNIIDNEMVFQSFKRIYNQRVQLIIIPFLVIINSLCKKLLPYKKAVWSILNKSGKIVEASFYMNDIQKSMIRMKKAQELLMQEGYSTEDNIKENIDFLMFLSSTINPLYPVYKAIKNELPIESKEFESLILSEFKIKVGNFPRPLAQVMLSYKYGDIAVKTSTKVMSYSNHELDDNFTDYLISYFKETIDDITIDFNISDKIREIILSVTESAKNKNWNISYIAEIIFTAILNFKEFLGRNDLKLLAYLVARELTAGILKVRYKLEEIIEGLALGCAYLENNSLGRSGEFVFENKINQKIVLESTLNGLTDTFTEIYPNLLSIDKYLDLFNSKYKKAVDDLKLKDY
ncbi:MAG: hypothetical protein ACK4IX_08155 [Candidatus Sericytochromatia bacterium]